MFTHHRAPPILSFRFYRSHRFYRPTGSSPYHSMRRPFEHGWNADASTDSLRDAQMWRTRRDTWTLPAMSSRLRSGSRFSA